MTEPTGYNGPGSPKGTSILTVLGYLFLGFVVLVGGCTAIVLLKK
jgi:hypothetical protein